MKTNILFSLIRNEKEIIFYIKNEKLDSIPSDWSFIADVEVYNQVKRSEKEDRNEHDEHGHICLTLLADEFVEKWDSEIASFATYEEAYIQGVYDFSDWLKQQLRNKGKNWGICKKGG